MTVDGRQVPTGVDSSKLGQNKNYTINGKMVSKNQAFAALGTPLPDDTKSLRFTVIGSESDRKKVLTDINSSPAFATIRPNLVIQDYEPNHYEVERSKFVNTGTPTIYLQANDGEVLLRTDTYEGPEQLSEAIRKADPNYDPSKDPNGKPKPVVNPTPATPQVPHWLIYVGLGAGAMFLLTRRK
jgi:hypothetical protein